MFVSISSPDSLLTWHHWAALAGDILSSASRVRAEASENSRIDGSRGADAKLIRCAAPLLRSLHCLSPVAVSSPAWSCPVPAVLLWVWCQHRVECDALLVKALVGSCWGANLDLAFFPFFHLWSSPTLATFLFSRGRRNSHTRHQVETLRHVGGLVLRTFSHFLYLFCTNKLFTCHLDRLSWRLQL